MFSCLQPKAFALSSPWPILPFPFVFPLGSQEWCKPCRSQCCSPGKLSVLRILYPCPLCKQVLQLLVLCCRCRVFPVNLCMAWKRMLSTLGSFVFIFQNFLDDFSVSSFSSLGIFRKMRVSLLVYGLEVDISFLFVLWVLFSTQQSLSPLHPAASWRCELSLLAPLSFATSVSF